MIHCKGSAVDLTRIPLQELFEAPATFIIKNSRQEISISLIISMGNSV